MFKSLKVFRTCYLSVRLYSSSSSQLPYQESKLLIKLRDAHFSRYRTSFQLRPHNLYYFKNIQDCSLLIKNHIQGTNVNQWSLLNSSFKMLETYSPTKFVKNNSDAMLERFFVLLYLSLHTYCSVSYYEIPNFKRIVKLIDFNIKDGFVRKYDKMPKDIDIDRDIDLDIIVNQLINEYCFNYSTNLHSQILDKVAYSNIRNSLYLVLLYFKEHGENYTIKDLSNWLISLNSSSIAVSYKSIDGLGKSVPIFIIKDFLMRQPRSAEDINILIKLYDQYCCNNSFEIVKENNLPSIFKNLVHGSVSYNTAKLSKLVEIFMDRQLISLQDRNWKIMISNSLIYELSQTNVVKIKDPRFFYDILNAQQLIILKLTKLYPEVTVNDLLSIEGYLGLTETLANLHQFEKAGKMMELAKQEDKQFLLNSLKKEGFEKISANKDTNDKSFKEFYIEQISKKDLKRLELQARMFSSELKLCSTSSDLIEAFSRLTRSTHSKFLLVKYPIIWRTYVLKLKQFKLLTSGKARKIWEQYHTLITESEQLITYNIDSRFITELIKSIDSISYVNEIIGLITRNGKALNSNVLNAYLLKLYKQSKSELNYEIFTKNSRQGRNLEIKKLFDLENGSNYKKNAMHYQYLESKNFNKTIDYVRSLYRHISTPKRSTISSMLLGESYVNPLNIYKLYKTELGSRKLRPDENCLLALLNAVIVFDNYKDNNKGFKDEFLKWDNQYASQIVISEMKKNCYQDISKSTLNIQNNQEDGILIYPSDQIWFKYIKMLYKFNYTDELIFILKWWESLKFIPPKLLLLDYLARLPFDLSNDLRKHGEKYFLNKIQPDRIKSEMEFNNTTTNTEFHTTYSQQIGRERLSKDQDIYLLSKWPWPTRDELDNYRIVMEANFVKEIETKEHKNKTKSYT
ncbi:hypothetical protein PACTADRAFT_32304 [Pachysolen tannophilus NRRL Y-2460]|uniref:Uncharacterized protein n=1 Tax=Pachysolen tannophilus NRRL Y-2460 TaxID=669874 RepID=A0A1E4TYI4_PACTA|nr:hypothetical protein PACTADRAFT_32304 [Pachysolen tannophilus NRRL Y-2460]